MSVALIARYASLPGWSSSDWPQRGPWAGGNWLAPFRWRPACWLVSAVRDLRFQHLQDPIAITASATAKRGATVVAPPDVNTECRDISRGNAVGSLLTVKTGKTCDYSTVRRLTLGPLFRGKVSASTPFSYFAFAADGSISAGNWKLRDTAPCALTAQHFLALGFLSSCFTSAQGDHVPSMPT